MNEIKEGAMPPMVAEYTQVEDNLWLCYYKAAGFERVEPVDVLHPSMPALGEVFVLGAMGSGNTKIRALNAAKRRFKEVYHMGCFYRRKGDLSKVYKMNPLWDWSDDKTKRTWFIFDSCYGYGKEVHIIGTMRKFVKHPSIEDWVVVQDQFLDKSPREVKKVLRSAMRERITQLKDGWVPLYTPMSFGRKKLSILTPA